MDYRWTLKNKKTLITGGTRGIGKAVNDEFIKLGAETAIVARDTKELHTLVQKFQSRNINILAIQADVSKKEDRTFIFERINKE